MMTMQNHTETVHTDPPVTIDSAHLDYLQRMASAAMTRTPEVASRLQYEIDRAEVVPSRQMPPNVVTIGSQVSFRDESTGRDQTVTLVLPPEADIAQRRVSILTPIGVALFGLAEGATISWETRTGEERELTVLRVTPPAEASAEQQEASAV